jgi:hypothetical protein
MLRAIVLAAIALCGRATLQRASNVFPWSQPERLSPVTLENAHNRQLRF